MNNAAGAVRSIAAVAIALAAASARADSCMPDAVDLRGDWGKVRFAVEIADDADERGRGLMYREKMGRFSGMLFLYPKPQHAQFWMKNTLIPLDMIFADAQGNVLRIHENAIPQDLTVIDGGEGVLAVLEINGGMAAQLGITPGSQLRHPALPQDLASWPCAAD